MLKNPPTNPFSQDESEGEEESDNPFIPPLGSPDPGMPFDKPEQVFGDNVGFVNFTESGKSILHNQANRGFDTNRQIVLPDSGKTLTESTTESLIDSHNTASGDIMKSQTELENARAARLNKAHSLDPPPEPEYIAIGDEFEESRAKKLQRKKAQLKPTSPMCEHAFEVTGKHHFGSKDERSRWLQIERAAKPLDLQGRVKYPIEWINKMIDWAEKQNTLYQRNRLTFAVKINFSSLMSSIENEENKNSWLAWALQHRDKIKSVETDDWSFPEPETMKASELDNFVPPSMSADELDFVPGGKRYGQKNSR